MKTGPILDGIHGGVPLVTTVVIYFQIFKTRMQPPSIFYTHCHLGFSLPFQ